MKINYILELLLPAMTASLGTIGKDTDITIKRDSKGFPFFSAKHIKGILRERVCQFKKALGSKEEVETFVNKYFGKEGSYLKNKNKFNQIRFSNLKLILDNKNNIQMGTRYGIRINRKTKTTLPQSLFSYEFLIANNKFEGTLEFNDDICQNKEELRFILACLFHLDRIGGMKSRGIGKVNVKIKLNNEEFEIKELDFIVNKLIEENSSKNSNNKNLSEELEKYSYTLELKEPIVLQEKKLGNYIKSRNFIQGSAIRGAIIEHFNKEDFEINILKNIEASDAIRLIPEKFEKEEIKLASLFKTKYPLKNNDEPKFIDKVIETDGEVIDEEDIDEEGNKNEIKLERASLSSLEISGNDISIKIDQKLKSVENRMLFNFEYIDNIRIKKNDDRSQDIITNKFSGDLKLPKNLVKIGDTFTIYLGKYRSKGFGKAILSIEEYTDKNISNDYLKDDIETRIIDLTKKVKENMEEKIKDDEEKQTNEKRNSIEDELKNMNKKVICFDLQSDLIIPFSEIYDAGEQFLMLARLNNAGLKFNTRRSFINIAKLEGYNIINNIRKVDELIFSRGSVFTFNIDNYCDILNKLVEIEKNGLGLRKNEGFGKIKICSKRRGANDKNK